MYRGYRTLGRIGPRGTIVTVSHHIRLNKTLSNEPLAKMIVPITITPGRLAAIECSGHSPYNAIVILIILPRRLRRPTINQHCISIEERLHEVAAIDLHPP